MVDEHLCFHRLLNYGIQTMWLWAVYILVTSMDLINWTEKTTKDPGSSITCSTKLSLSNWEKVFRIVFFVIENSSDIFHVTKLVTLLFGNQAYQALHFNKLLIWLFRLFWLCNAITKFSADNSSLINSIYLWQQVFPYIFLCNLVLTK